MANTLTKDVLHDKELFIFIRGERKTERKTGQGVRGERKTERKTGQGVRMIEVEKGRQKERQDKE